MINRQGLKSLLYELRVAAHYWPMVFRRRMKGRRKFPERVRRILVVTPDHLGDTVCLFPMLFALKDKYPEAEITAVTGTFAAAKVLGLLPFELENVRVDAYKAKRISKDFQPAALNKLAGKNYDLAVFSGQGRFPAYQVLIKNTQVDYVLGIGKGGVFDERVPYSDDVNEKVQHLKLIGCENMPSLKDRLVLKEDPELKPLADNRPFLIHIGTKQQEKRWPVEKFTTLAKKLSQKGDVVLLGGPAEQPELEKIKEDGFTVLKKVLPFENLAWFLASARRLVCIDAGPMHIADLLDVPMTVLMYSAPIKRWGPVSKKAEIVSPPPDQMIKDLTVDYVLAKVPEWTGKKH